MKILITGTNGFLGRKLFTSLKDKYEVYGTSRRMSCLQERIYLVDLLDEKEPEKIIEETSPDILINTASIVDVDKCEKNNKLAHKTHISLTEKLVRLCNNNKIKLIQFSSDYVFSGEEDGYLVSSKKRPINYYGQTKSSGEDIILKSSNNSTIVRPTWLYGFNSLEDKNNFVLNVLNRLSQDKEVILDNRRIKYPLLIDDVSKAVQEIIEFGYNGIFHISGKDETTKYSMGLKIAKMFGFQENLVIGKDLNEINRPYKIKFLDGWPKTTGLDEGLKLIKKQMEEFKRK